MCGEQETFGGEVELAGVCHRPNNPCYIMDKSEELKKEWEEDLAFNFTFLHEIKHDKLGDAYDRVKSFISSLLAKQQIPTAITNSEWVAYGKKMGYHDYWKDMTRIAVEEEFVKMIPKYANSVDLLSIEEFGERARITNLLNENMVVGYNQCIADIKSKLNK